jgi:hypothetical protein
LELKKRTPVLLQFTVIVLTSVAASYAFQNTESVYQINGLGFYRYLAYISAVFLSYVCFANYKKHVAFAFSFALSAVALSPISQQAVELFHLLVCLLAVLMGVISVLIVPSSRGKGFFEFLVVLVLPAILAKSRIGGTSGLLATTKSIGYFELSVITASVVGGYFYFRYATSANLRRIELLSNGGNEKDVAEVAKLSNNIIILIVAVATGISALLMVTAPIAADALQGTMATVPIFVLALTMIAGLAVTTIFYIFQRSHREPRLSCHR